MRAIASNDSKHFSMGAAVKERLIVRNPTKGTKIPKANHKEKKILTEAQLDAFMEVIKQGELWYDFFYTELTTGLRLGEICGLKWQDFDETNVKLRIARTIHQKKGGGLTAGETKTTQAHASYFCHRVQLNF
jgi:integrase